MDNIFLNINGKTEGPYSRDLIKEKLARKEISLEDYSWHEGCIDWVQLKSLPYFQSATPPPFVDPQLKQEWIDGQTPDQSIKARTPHKKKEISLLLIVLTLIQQIYLCHCDVIMLFFFIPVVLVYLFKNTLFSHRLVLLMILAWLMDLVSGLVFNTHIFGAIIYLVLIGGTAFFCVASMEKNGFLTIPKGNSDFKIVLAYRELAQYLKGPEQTGAFTGTPMGLIALVSAYLGYWALSAFLQSVMPGWADGETPPFWLCILLTFLTLAASIAGSITSVLALTMKKGRLGGISLFINIGVLIISIIFGCIYSYAVSQSGGSSGRYGLPHSSE
jgi:GYF domain 2